MSIRALRDLENGRATAPQERSAGLLASALGLTGDERVSFLVLAKEGRRRCNRVEDRASLHALPAVSHLVGRERELRWLSGEAEAGGTVVLAGPPGVGKTTLAVMTAHRLSEQFPDGCLAIDLRGVDDRTMSPHAALERLLTWLGVPASRIPRSEGERVSLYRALLRDRRVLVLLDDALDEAQVEPLLGNGEHSLTIVTCRRALLNLESARRLSLDVLIAADAVRLVESIVGEDLVRQETEGAEELVSLCGNLPLAVRLVGNRLATRGLSIPYLVRQLHDERLRLDALSAGDLNLRSVLEVSFRRLSPRARSVFRRLALIPGADFDDDLATAARTHGLIDVLTEHKVTTLADKAYQGAGGRVRTPFKRHATRPRLSRGQKAVNRAHARIRALGERAVSLLKGWKVLTKLHCCPRRATAIVAAILVLHHTGTRRQPR